MKLLLVCLMVGVTAGATPFPSPTLKSYLRYVKLVAGLDSDPVQLKLRSSEQDLIEAQTSGDPSRLAKAREHFLSAQRQFLKLYSHDFQALARSFADAQPDAVASTFSGGNRVVFKADHPFARAFNIDPHGVDHPWDPFERLDPRVPSFLKEAHAFVANTALELLNAVVTEIKDDPSYRQFASYPNTFSELPDDLDQRYRPVFDALLYAFTRKDPQVLNTTVGAAPFTTGPRSYFMRDLLTFDVARKSFDRHVEALDFYARSCAGLFAK